MTERKSDLHSQNHHSLPFIHISSQCFPYHRFNEDASCFQLLIGHIVASFILSEQRGLSVYLCPSFITPSSQWMNSPAIVGRRERFQRLMNTSTSSQRQSAHHGTPRSLASRWNSLSVGVVLSKTLSGHSLHLKRLTLTAVTQPIASVLSQRLSMKSALIRFPISALLRKPFMRWGKGADTWKYI